MAKEQYNIELYPMGSDRIIPCVQYAVTVGQKLTVSWKSDALYTNRYVMRTLTAILDNTAQYKLYVPSVYGLTGTETFAVTTAGTILFAGYAAGQTNSNLIGDYVKVKIEDPE